MAYDSLGFKMNNKGTIGFFPGNWDLCHVGQVRALKEASEQCDWLIVGIKESNNDSPDKNQPIMSVEERIEILKAMKGIDDVIVYQSEAMLKVIDADNVLNQDIRFMGIDHKKDKKYPTDAKIVYISRNHNYSSSGLRKRCYEAETERLKQE